MCLMYGYTYGFSYFVFFIPIRYAIELWFKICFEILYDCCVSSKLILIRSYSLVFFFFFFIKLEVQKWVANLTNSWYMLFLLQVDLTSVEGFDCRFAFRFRLIWVYWNLWTFILDVLVLCFLLAMWWKCTLISGKICVNWWLISKFIRNCSSDFRKADFPFAMYFVWLSLSCSLWDQLLFKVHFITFWFSVHFLNEICRMISLSIFT